MAIDQVMGKAIIAGEAEGCVLKLDAPISFWGGVNPKTARIILANHPQEGIEISDTVLVIPSLIGSSSSSAVMLELLHAGRAPRAIILGNRDAILCLGVIVAEEMGWVTIPVVEAPVDLFQTGQWASICESGEITID